MELISRFFGASVTQFQYRITTEEVAIGAGGHRMGFTPPRVRSHRVWRSSCLRESDHAQCRGVYIFNSEYWNEKIKIKFFIKNRIAIKSREKTTIITSLIGSNKWHNSDRK